MGAGRSVGWFDLGVVARTNGLASNAKRKKVDKKTGVSVGHDENTPTSVITNTTALTNCGCLLELGKRRDGGGGGGRKRRGEGERQERKGAREKEREFCLWIC